MALLVDGNISSIGDLQAYDSSVLEIGRSEGVDLEQKLAVAAQEIGLQLKAFLLRQRARVPMDASGTPDLTPIVVTPGLRLWHTLRTLALTYGDVSGNQLSSRLKPKFLHFETESRRAAEAYFETGVGITAEPIGRAGAPEIVTGGIGGVGAAYAVSVSWRNQRGETGAASLPVTVRTQTGEGFMVRATGAPNQAAGFDVFAGESNESLTQQNQIAVPPGEWWALPPAGLTKGTPPGEGQEPDYWIRKERALRRG